jgi:hypothetical protein
MLLPKLGGFWLLPPRDFPQPNESHPMDHDSNSSGHTRSQDLTPSYSLSMERVSIISPLVNGSSLFVVPISMVVLKDVEKVTWRKIGAIGLVIFGVFLISWEKL